MSVWIQAVAEPPIIYAGMQVGPGSGCTLARPFRCLEPLPEFVALLTLASCSKGQAPIGSPHR